MSNHFDIKRLIDAIEEDTPLYIIEMVRGEILDIFGMSNGRH